jgi:predicted transcriptional regulator
MQDWLEDLSKEEKEEIETGLKQAENREFIEHEEMMKVFSKYKPTTK